MLTLSYFLSVAYATDFSSGKATVGPIVIPIPIDGGVLEQITHFIATTITQPKRLANVSITIYELPDNNTVADLVTDKNGMANITLTAGVYHYVARYNGQVVEGTFTQVEKRTIFLEFVAATPFPLWQSGLGIVVIGAVLVVALEVNKKARKKKTMTKARHGTEKGGRKPRLEPDSYNGRRPLAQGKKGEGYNGGRPLGHGKKGKWKFPRSEGEGYSS